MRASMRLRLSDRRSSSSPEPFDRQASGQVALHDGAGGGGKRVDAGEQFAADPIAAADAEQGHDAEPPQHGRTDHARQLAPVLDVAADDQPVAARQPEHIGEGEPPLDPARRRAPIDELDRAEAVPQIGRHGAEIARQPAALAVGHQIEAVAGRLRPFGHRADELVEPARPVLLGQPFELGIDGLIELPRQQNRGVPIDVEDGHDGGRAEQRKIGQR